MAAEYHRVVLRESSGRFTPAAADSSGLVMPKPCPAGDGSGRLAAYPSGYGGSKRNCVPDGGHSRRRGGGNGPPVGPASVGKVCLARRPFPWACAGIIRAGSTFSPSRGSSQRILELIPKGNAIRWRSTVAVAPTGAPLVVGVVAVSSQDSRPPTGRNSGRTADGCECNCLPRHG
jgi:hypothetical protein